MRRDDAVAGWAGVTDGHLTIQAPDDEPAARALLDWAIEHSTGHDLDIAILDGDTALSPVLDEAGFAPAGDERLSGMFHPASSQQSALPLGYSSARCARVRRANGSRSSVLVWSDPFAVIDCSAVAIDRMSRLT